MAVSVTPNDGDFPAVIVKEASASTVTSADVFDGPKSVYSITVNNAANAGSFAVVRLYNSLTATTASVPTSTTPATVRPPTSKSMTRLRAISPSVRPCRNTSSWFLPAPHDRSPFPQGSPSQMGLATPP